MMNKVFQCLFIGLIIVSLTIVYNYLPNPLTLFFWGFAGDGNLFIFCYGILQILIYNLILRCWKSFRNNTLWTIIMSVELPILFGMVPVLVTDPSFGSFLAAIDDFTKYGTISFLFVVFLLEIAGIVFYYVLKRVTSNRRPISTRVARCFFVFDCLVLIGGIIYYKNDDITNIDNNISYMMTPDGKYYIFEHRTADSLYVEISDDNSFADRFEFVASKVEPYLDHVFIKLFPNNVIEIDYPDSLLTIIPTSKYAIFFNETSDSGSFLSKSELSYSCYYFWFYFSKKTRTACYLEMNKNNEMIKMKQMRLRDVDGHR